jgi:hypothetical protein
MQNKLEPGLVGAGARNSTFAEVCGGGAHRTAPDLVIGIFQMKNVARYARLSCYIQLSDAFAFSESVF